ncbi:hypothetical protein ABEF95_014355 [Exophiala dermatitidis]
MAHPEQPRKRIVVCCDGTWKDSDGDYQTPSNVTRIARAIAPVGVDTSTGGPDQPTPIPQVVFYQNGVGTGSNSLYDKYIGGATGEGLAEHIREAYSFICLNYNAGDEIFLIGFSRGAFTARSISSLINAAGLLTAKGLEFFVQVFEDWEFQQKKDFKSKWPNLPFVGHKPPVTDPHYQRQLIQRGLTRPNVKVKCVAVWDTVGGLGIPMIGLLPQPPSTDFAFVDTRVESNIEYAFQALALDEHRRSFSPTVWDWPRVEPHDLKVLKQTWFPGVHSDIGGSYDDTALANLTLAWMVAQLDPILTIKHDYIMELIRPSSKDRGHHGHHDGVQGGGGDQGFTNEGGIQGGGHQSFTHDGRAVTVHNTLPHLRPWGLGKIHDSFTFFFKLGGSRVRTPGEYREQELASQHGMLVWMVSKLHDRLRRLLPGKAGKQVPLLPRLQRTNETIHSSVRIRMGRDGLGYNDKGKYDCDALQGWVMHGVETDPETPIAESTPGSAVGKMTSVVWKKVVPAEKVVDVDVDASVDGGKRVSVVEDYEEGEEVKKTQVIELPEEPLGQFERTILRFWPEINSGFDSIVPGKHAKKLNRAGTYPVGWDRFHLFGGHKKKKDGGYEGGGSPAVADRDGEGGGLRNRGKNTENAGAADGGGTPAATRDDGLKLVTPDSRIETT